MYAVNDANKHLILLVEPHSQLNKFVLQLQSDTALHAVQTQKTTIT
jgi:hypothetical protein